MESSNLPSTTDMLEPLMEEISSASSITSTTNLIQLPMEIKRSSSTTDLLQLPMDVATSAMNILQLPELVKEHLISRYLQKEQLDIACCSKDYCYWLGYIFWREVFIPWTDLSPLESFPSSLKMNLQHVNILNFVSRSSSLTYPAPLAWTQVVDKYRVVLDNCNQTRVRQLTTRNMLTDEGMQMLCEKLGNLKELKFVDCTDISVSGWEQLVALKNLKTLSLKNCFIRNTGIEVLVNILSLEELNLDIDWRDNIYITRNALKHFSGMRKLKRLTISCSYELEFSVRDLKCLKILDKLEELSLEQTLLDDDALTYLCKHAKNLEVLNIKGCHEITERGLLELIHLPLLKRVNLQDIKVSDTVLAVLSKQVGMLEMRDTCNGIFTKGK